jgi:tRNA dimethylallyltransferase
LEELQQKAHETGLDMTGIDLRNKRRIIRLIENGGLRPTKSALRPNTLVIGIQVERDQLRERVNRRVDAMFAAGLETEVRTLSNKYGWDVEPMKGIGYREWRPYVVGYEAQSGERVWQTLQQTHERIVAATMGLAKRQRTWFKRNDCIQWVQEPNTLENSVDLVTTFLADNS